MLIFSYYELLDLNLSLKTKLYFPILMQKQNLIYDILIGTRPNHSNLIVIKQSIGFLKKSTIYLFYSSALSCYWLSINSITFYFDYINEIGL
jgi:hypothetical protein